jgi:hypothetical protein
MALSWAVLTITCLLMLAGGALAAGWTIELALPIGAAIAVATYLLLRAASPRGP